MGCHSLVQGIFLTQGLNLGLLHYRHIRSLFYIFKKFSFFPFLIYLFSIEGQLLYNILLVSVIHQHESAIDIHMSLPLEPLSHLPLHPTPLGCHRLAMSLSRWDLSSLTRDRTHILCTGSSES